MRGSKALSDSQTGGLVRFVLGSFVGLALARTYYANRSLLGDVFGGDRPGEYVWAFLDEAQARAGAPRAGRASLTPTHRA